MSDRALILWSRVIAVATLGSGIAAAIIAQRSGIGGITTPSTLQELSGTLIVPAVTWIALPRVPRNGSVWAFTIVGLGLGLVALGDTMAEAISGISSEGVVDGLVTAAPADLPILAAVGLLTAMTLWILSAPLMTVFVLLLFPDGRYPEPRTRWRWLGRIAAMAIVTGVVSGLVLYWPTGKTSYSEIATGDSVAAVTFGVTGMIFILATIGAIVGYAVKWKRAEGESRVQYRWVGFAFLIFAVWQVFSIVTPSFSGDALQEIVSWLLIAFIPVAYTVAITKYRLYDIDVVVSRTLAYAVLAGFITGVYALIVVGIGTVLGGESNLALSVAAVAVVAVAFEPLRVRVQRWANRLVYGARATPYEVLARSTRRLADTRSAEQTLAGIVDLVVAGTGASEAVLWIRTGERLRPQTASPLEVLQAFGDVPVESDLNPEIPGDLSVPVHHRGELLGAVSISKPRGQSVTKADEKVLSDVSAGAGLLLRNIGLNTELTERAEQLRLSRRRLVEAHDAERHRLERDLHDGAQQQVVALKVKLGIARTLAGREEADRVVSIVESLAEDAQAAVDEMRAVAHGIYPPLLESEGLAAALGALARSLPVPVEVDADDAVRLDQSVEETAYFCILDAVNRAVDAGAGRISVGLAYRPGALEFTVACDVPVGRPDLVVDRVDAQGGTVSLSSVGGGTVLAGALPIQSTRGAAETQP